MRECPSRSSVVFQRSSAGKEKQESSDRLKGRRLLERIDRAYRSRDWKREFRMGIANAITGIKIGCHLTWNGKGEGEKARRAGVNTGGTREQETERRGKYNVTVRWIGWEIDFDWPWRLRSGLQIRNCICVSRETKFIGFLLDRRDVLFLS